MYLFETQLEWMEGGFNDPKFRKGVPKFSGVYVLYLEETPINRLIGTDEHGVLYVGESKNLKRRLKQFNASACGKSGHSGGNLYYYADLARVFSLEKIFIKYHVTENKGMAKEIESKILKQYVKIYCELPPLNSNKS